VADVQGLGPNTQAVEERVDVGLWVLTIAFCGVEGVDGAQRRESHGQA
jgi:hypothetical protein